MKVLFLDIDGVCNSRMFSAKQFAKGVGGFLGIDPAPAELVRDIIDKTGCKVVLSSTWRLSATEREKVRNQVCEFIDVTPDLPHNNKNHKDYRTHRGTEVQAWLDGHPEVKQYAILDDDSDFLPEQHLFQTTFMHGLNRKIADDVIKHLNIDQPT